MVAIVMCFTLFLGVACFIGGCGMTVQPMRESLRGFRSGDSDWGWLSLGVCLVTVFFIALPGVAIMAIPVGWVLGLIDSSDL